jgi:hypothetical protein
MIDLLTLLWQFLRAQPTLQYVSLASWHLLAVLVVLGVLSAFGLHFLVGHVFGFYRRKERLVRWVSLPTLLVLLVSLQALLGAYLLGVRSEALVHANLTTGVAEQLGKVLLEPAFQGALLLNVPADQVNKDVLKNALHTSPELDYRNQLAARLLPPDELQRAMQGTAPPLGADVLVQIGLHWVTESHASWFGSEPAPAAAGNGGAGADAGAAGGDKSGGAFFLPDFLISLVDELPAGTVLPRVDWEHVAGTRYVENVLRPLMNEYLSDLAIVLAVIVLLLDALFFLLMRRLKRIGLPRPAKAKAPPKSPPKPGPAPSAAKSPAPDAPGGKPGAAAASTPATPPAAPTAADAPKPEASAGGSSSSGS